MGGAIEARSLTIERGGHLVIAGLDLVIEPGAVTGLIGPSGSGKTTLMRAIAGVQRVKSGSVNVLGEPAGSTINRDRVAYMTQASSVYPDLTAKQNVAYFARLAGAAPDRVDQVLEQVDLTEQADALTSELSGGQHARVSLASALVADPRVCLLDEPTVGLDPVLRRDLWDMFASLAAAGVTLLVSSHVMDEAARCDRVLLLRSGRLVAADTPDGLRAAAGTDDLDEAFLRLAERSGP